MVLDIPLLFENNLQKICDYVFLAHCPTKLREARALKRKNMNIKVFNKFIELQEDDQFKKKKADFVINTSKSKKFTNKQIQNAIKRKNIK